MGLDLVVSCPVDPSSIQTRKVFGGRYRATRLLKRGRGVETLLGTDLLHDEPVVIKTAQGKALSLGAQMRLEHEAGVLRQIRSPWIATLQDLGREDDLLYLVMPYVSGLTLADRLAQGPLSVRDAVTVGCCLMAALQEVHDQGALHRDLKPSNVIVDDDTPRPRATFIHSGSSVTAP